MIIINEKDIIKLVFLLLRTELMFKIFFHHIKQLCKSFIALHESHLKLKQKISLRGSFGEKKEKIEFNKFASLQLYIQGVCHNKGQRISKSSIITEINQELKKKKKTHPDNLNFDRVSIKRSYN